LVFWYFGFMVLWKYRNTKTPNLSINQCANIFLKINNVK